MIYFVTAIHTDSGKSLVSAILTHALQADYWKPVQTGSDSRDVETVRGLVNNEHSLYYQESYLLKLPVSPHEAAAAENLRIELDKIILPDTGGNHLVIEGAGGVLVPLNEKDYIIDIAAKFDAEVILVSNLYLGSINHTLLSVNEIRRRGLKIKGIVFNGPDNRASREIILKKTELRQLLYIRPEKNIDQSVVTRYAIELFENWDD